MKNKIGIIAIDGPSSSGKGTVSKKLAAIFNIPCLNTGSLYRALAYLALQNNLDLAHQIEQITLLKNQILNLDLESKELHNEEIAKAASTIASDNKIRKSLLNFQLDFIKDSLKKNAGVILEGRDIGTIICPDADHKFFIDASAKVRADRRFKQTKETNPNADYNQILEQIIKRDLQDRNRPHSPLKKAKDAILIDTSDLIIQEVVNIILNSIQNASAKN